MKKYNKPVLFYLRLLKTQTKSNSYLDNLQTSNLFIYLFLIMQSESKSFTYLQKIKQIM